MIPVDMLLLLSSWTLIDASKEANVKSHLQNEYMALEEKDSNKYMVDQIGGTWLYLI